MTQMIYRSAINAVGVRGIPPIKWEDSDVNLRKWVNNRMRGIKNARVYGQRQMGTLLSRQPP